MLSRRTHIVIMALIICIGVGIGVWFGGIDNCCDLTIK